MWNAPMVQSRQPLTYRLMESVGLRGPRWHGNSWQRGIAENGSSRPSTLMIDIPGDLVWDLPCVQQASYLEGDPLVWMLPLYLHVNQKFDYDMILYDSCNHKVPTVYTSEVRKWQSSQSRKKVTKIDARIYQKHMHIFRLWKKHVRFNKIGIQLYEELCSRSIHC